MLMHSPLINPRAPAPDIDRKWGALTEGIKGAVKKRAAAFVMENQVQWIESMARSGSFNGRFMGSANIFETTTTANIEVFTQQMIAIIEQIFERMMIDNLVQLRVMRGPTALIGFPAMLQGSAGSPGFYSAGDPFDEGIDPDYADCPTECSAFNEADFEWTNTTMTARCKGLTSRFSKQAEQDAASQYGVNLRDRFMRFFTTEFLREIQGEVLGLLVANAASTTLWSSTAPAGSVYLSLDPKVYDRTLIDEAIQDADNDIFTSPDGNRNAEWIAGDPTAITRLMKLNKYQFQRGGTDREGSTEGKLNEFAGQFGPLGTIDAMWKFRYMPSDTLLLGIRGSGDGEMAHVHGVYIPISDLGTFQNPRTGCIDVGAITRIGDATVRPGRLSLLQIT